MRITSNGAAVGTRPDNPFPFAIRSSLNLVAAASLDSGLVFRFCRSIFSLAVDSTLQIRTSLSAAQPVVRRMMPMRSSFVTNLPCGDIKGIQEKSCA